MIKKQVLVSCLGVLSDNYSKPTTDATAQLWYGFFKDFDEYLFKKTCEKILKTSSYFPKINEFIATYKQIQKEIEQEKFEKLKESNRLLTQEQKDCYLCNNTGFCDYERNGYKFWARCICAHGKDLNKFTKAQIEKAYIPEISSGHCARDIEKLKKGINPFYILTIKEALKEKYLIFEAEKKAQKIDKLNLSDEEKIRVLHSAFINN